MHEIKKKEATVFDFLLLASISSYIALVVNCQGEL